jgi:hypothetical protein
MAGRAGARHLTGMLNGDPVVEKILTNGHALLRLNERTIGTYLDVR